MKYKIIISEMEEEEVPETEYRNTKKKDEKGEEIWDYVKTGKSKIRRNEREIYTQEIDDLDIGELVCYINRVR